MIKPSFNLSKETIKGMFSTTTYQRGLSYYRQGQVIELSYDDNTALWRAQVSGGEIYDVTVKMDQRGIDTNCNCPANEKFWECKHEAAVLLQLTDILIEKKEAPSTPVVDYAKRVEYERTNRLISAFSQQQYIEVNDFSQDQQPLMVEYTLKPYLAYPAQNGEYLTLQLKVGQTRFYVVKKVKEFLDNVNKDHSHFFTNKFSYDPTEHYFEPEDKEILQLLQETAKNEKMYQHASPYHWSQSSIADERELLVPPTILEKLLPKLIARGARYEDHYTSNSALELDETYELPISFNLEPSNTEEDFNLDLKEVEGARLFEPYGLLYLKQKLFKVTNHQEQVLKELIALSKHPILTIGKDQIEPFLSHAAPALKTLGALKVEDTISNKIVAPELAAKLFIDYQAKQLKVELEYHYGERIINPFSVDSVIDTTRTELETDKDIILIRDTIKEQEIMNIVESSPLKYNGKELYIEREEDLYDFLYHTLAQFENKVEVYIKQDLSHIINMERSKPALSVELDESGNWLDFSFDLEGIDEEEVHHLLQSVIEKKRYYRLSNGAFISLEDEGYESIHLLFQELDIKKTEVKKGKIKSPIFKGIQLEEMMKGTTGGPIRYGKAFRKFIQRFKNPDQLDFELPKDLDAMLRDYQLFGYQWLKTLGYYHLGGILADDMGLGKTLQSIAYIASEIEESKKAQVVQQPILVVTPASLIYNWKNEFSKFSPELRVAIIDGNPDERKGLLESLQDADVWITSYPLLRQDIEYYENQIFSTLFLDEAQAIKNPATKTFKAVKQIEAIQKFALSGTPIENSIEELWSIFQVIMPGLFPSKNVFKHLPHERISKMVRPFILRRLKKDVLKELPDKIETIQVSELTKQQKELYIGYLEKIQNETKASISSEGFDKSRIKILAGLTRLRQICNHPSLFLENYDGESGKLDQLMELIENSIENGNRLLIFSQFTSMLQIISERLREQNYSYFYLDGQTPGKERVEMANQFNHGEKEIFLISLKAGGTGLNLTGADMVILFDLWWNPAVEDQAAGRAHRIGQKKVVQVMRMITQGTIEERIHRLQQKKKELVEKVIQSGETMLNTLSEEEILEILGI